MGKPGTLPKFGSAEASREMPPRPAIRPSTKSRSATPVGPASKPAPLPEPRVPPPKHQSGFGPRGHGAKLSLPADTVSMPTPDIDVDLVTDEGEAGEEATQSRIVDDELLDQLRTVTPPVARAPSIDLRHPYDAYGDSSSSREPITQRRESVKLCRTDETPQARGSAPDTVREDVPSSEPRLAQIDESEREFWGRRDAVSRRVNANANADEDTGSREMPTVRPPSRQQVGAASAPVIRALSSGSLQARHPSAYDDSNAERLGAAWIPPPPRAPADSELAGGNADVLRRPSEMLNQGAHTQRFDERDHAHREPTQRTSARWSANAGAAAHVGPHTGFAPAPPYVAPRPAPFGVIAASSAAMRQTPYPVQGSPYPPHPMIAVAHPPHGASPAAAASVAPMVQRTAPPAAVPTSKPSRFAWFVMGAAFGALFTFFATGFALTGRLPKLPFRTATAEPKPAATGAPTSVPVSATAPAAAPIAQPGESTSSNAAPPETAATEAAPAEAAAKPSIVPPTANTTATAVTPGAATPATTATAASTNGAPVASAPASDRDRANAKSAPARATGRQGVRHPPMRSASSNDDAADPSDLLGAGLRP